MKKAVWITGLSFLPFAAVFWAPASFAGGKEITFAVFSDAQGRECQPKYPEETIFGFSQLLAQPRFDHLLFAGDAVHGECMKYEGVQPYPEVVDAMWAEWDLQFVQKARALGLFPITTPGNHDAPFLRPGGRETFVAENEGFKKYWLANRKNLGIKPIRVPGFADRYPYYWAYRTGNILVVILHSTREHLIPDPEEQKAWLRAVLKTHDARHSSFKIAMMHVPAYAVLDPSVGFKYSEIVDEEQVGKPDGLVDLLLNHRVNLLITGHSHAPYPAYLTRKSDRRRLAILSMPCLHSPRKLFSKPDPAMKGFAMVKILPNSALNISFYNSLDGTQVPYSYFPEKIPTDEAVVLYRRIPEAQYR